MRGIILTSPIFIYHIPCFRTWHLMSSGHINIHTFIGEAKGQNVKEEGTSFLIKVFHRASIVEMVLLLLYYCCPIDVHWPCVIFLMLSILNVSFYYGIIFLLFVFNNLFL